MVIFRQTCQGLAILLLGMTEDQAQSKHGTGGLTINNKLVKRLREAAISADSGNEISESLYRDILQAADAIEELSKKYLASEVDNTNLTGWLAEEHAKHLWIPVTERLPIGGDDSGAICENVCLLMDDGTVSCGWMNGITKKVYYLNARDDFVIKAPITRVTHWMPLPQPPEEG